MPPVGPIIRVLSHRARLGWGRSANPLAGPRHGVDTVAECALGRVDDEMVRRMTLYPVCFDLCAHASQQARVRHDIVADPSVTPLAALVSLRGQASLAAHQFDHGFDAVRLARHGLGGCRQRRGRRSAPVVGGGIRWTGAGRGAGAHRWHPARMPQPAPRGASCARAHVRSQRAAGATRAFCCANVLASRWLAKDRYGTVWSAERDG